jgi:hypothetical protein
MTDRETRVLFAYAPSSTQPNGVPLVTLMMPQKAWDYMVGGLGHEFDMTKLGIPMRILIGRCQDHADGVHILEVANGGTLKRAGYNDVTDRDLSFKTSDPP